jgi:nucleoside phosphorylase
MTSQDEIANQQKLLGINRARLKVLLEQQTSMGVFTPAYVQLEIGSARHQIRDIKRILRGWNLVVEDMTGDEPPTDAQVTAPSAGQQMSSTSATSGLIAVPTPTTPKPRSKPRSASKSGPDIYISYNQADKAWVSDELLPRIEDAGLQAIVDYRDFEIGVPKLVNIERAVERTRQTLIVMTPDWLASHWNAFQGILASTEDPSGVQQKLLPIMLERCKPPARIAMLEILDLTDPAERTGQIDRLVRSLTKKPGRATVGRSTESQARQPTSQPNNVSTLGETPALAPEDAPVDFVIIAPLTEERNAVLKQLREYQKLPPSSEDIRVYYCADVATPFGSYRVIVTSPMSMGRGHANTVAGDAIRRWHPRYILLVGIAGGAPPKEEQQTAGETGGVAANGVRLGDVLIAEQIVDYESQKIERLGTDVRWEAYPADPQLLIAAKNFDDDGWQQSIKQQRPEKGAPNLHFGPMLSGDKVFAFGKLFAQYRQTWSKLKGVEMEAGGVALAAAQSPRKPGFFMIRGVSDLADEKKGMEDVERWRPYACHVAAAYAIALLQSGPVPLSALSPAAAGVAGNNVPASATKTPSAVSAARQQRRAALEDRLAALIADQTAATSQQNRSLNDVETNRLQRTIDHLQKQIDQVEQDLKTL